MSKKPGIPAIGPRTVMQVLDALKQNVETLTGVRGAPLSQLKDDATTAEIVGKINEIIVRLNARGQ